MRSGDLDQVAHLHCDALPEDPAALLGVDYLATSLYPTLLAAASVALVLESGDDGRVDGFVVFGTGNPLSMTVRDRPVAFARSLGAAVLRRPAILGKAVDVAMVVLGSPSGLPALELQWIAIRDGARGMGAGTRLLAAAHERLSAVGVAALWVKTLEATPENIRFYERNGFAVVARSRGRVYLVTRY
jgi:ribosomal protein S18 acetylase RimI-like enzyme